MRMGREGRINERGRKLREEGEGRGGRRGKGEEGRREEEGEWYQFY